MITRERKQGYSYTMGTGKNIFGIQWIHLGPYWYYISLPCCNWLDTCNNSYKVRIWLLGFRLFRHEVLSDTTLTPKTIKMIARDEGNLEWINNGGGKRWELETNYNRNSGLSHWHLSSKSHQEERFRRAVEKLFPWSCMEKLICAVQVVGYGLVEGARFTFSLQENLLQDSDLASWHHKMHHLLFSSF